MKNIILTLGVLTLTLGFIGCGAPAANNTAANKPANAANTTNTNAAANTAANTAAAPAADGQVIKIEEAGIQVTVPKGFKFSKDGEDTIVQSEDDGVDIRFTVPKDGDYEKLLGDAGAEIDYLKDVKMDSKEGTKRDVAGMEGHSLTGTAKTDDGEAVAWNLTVIKAPKKPVLVNIYAEKSSLEKHAAGTKALLESIKKL